MTTKCTWPACLTDEQQQELADEVLRQMAGEEPSAPQPDQRAVCRCMPAANALRRQYAAAIHRYDYEHGLSGNDLPSDHHRGEADAVMTVRDHEMEKLRAEHAALKRAHVALAEQAGKEQAALAEVRRLCEMTIDVSVRAQAIEQARDTLAIIDRNMGGEGEW